MPPFLPITYAFACSTFGVWVFHVFHLPLPWLLGPIFACLIAALLGIPLGGIKPLNAAMRTILGVAIGASLTPAVAAGIWGMWPTLLMVPVMLIIIGAIGVPYFQRLCGYDFPTAYYATMPGGLQDMLVFGEESGANPRALSLIHATRVLFIVAVLPFALQGIWDADLTMPPGEPARDLPFYEMILMAFCAFAGLQIATRIGMFGASILGPLLLTAVVTLAGGLTHRPPVEAIWMAQFFLGMVVGTKYSGITVQEVRHDLTAAIGFCGILTVISVSFTAIIVMSNFAPAIEALLAFSPGGQAELSVLALIVGADMAFVIAHHILRIFLVIFGAPIAAKFLSK